MKPITITLTTTIDEEIDQAIYGDFYAFSRIDPEHPWENRPFVQLKKGGEWIPIKDWKSGRYIITDGQLRAIARHFLEVGKRISGLIDLDEICRAAGISEPFMDGNQWSILKGANIQEGVVGFGDTKEEALVNFIKDIPIQQEQPKVDLEKEFNSFLDNVEGVPRMWHSDEQIEWAKDIALHFYELGRNARKEGGK